MRIPPEFSDFTKAASLLTILFAAVGLISGVVFIIARPKESGVKLVGSLLVMALSFAANSPFVYPLGILIIATLVTELQFLEKLAAILWNRKEYWSYLSTHASQKEVEDKAKRELKETSSATSRQNERRAVDLAIEFQRLALQCLADQSSPLRIEQIETEVALASKGRRWILDGVATGQKYVYVVEVKASPSIRNIGDVAYQLSRYTDAYRSYAAERGITLPVRKLIVLPPGVTNRVAISDAAVLVFDMVERRFINVAAAREAFPDFDWK